MEVIVRNDAHRGLRILLIAPEHASAKKVLRGLVEAGLGNDNVTVVRRFEEVNRESTYEAAVLLANGSAMAELPVLIDQCPWPVVVVGESEDEEVGLRALELGAQEYLPFSSITPSRLLQSLRSARVRWRLRCRSHADETAPLWAEAVVHAAEAVVVTDPEGVVQFVNPAFEALTGYSADEIAGRHSRILKSGQHTEAFYRAFYETIAEGRKWQGRFINRRKNGGLFTVESTVAPALNEDGRLRGYIQTMLDVTAVDSMKLQLQRIQRLETIGQFAGGIAHDFNNVLQAIIGYASLTRAQMPAASDETENLDLVLDAARRASHLTRQLLAFGRTQIFKLEPVDLNSIVENMLKLLRPLIREDIDIQFKPCAGLDRAEIDVAQIEQIIMNLCTNGRDAISGHGQILIATSNAYIDPKQAADIGDCAAGHYVCLTISDTGEGMDAETLERIYDPFFTTKEHDHGTGLGLATVYGIVKQHNGAIDCSSTRGAGTTFRVYLPRFVQDEESRSGPAPVEPAAGETRSILVVEDDPVLRKLAVRVLKSAGHVVREADNGVEALHQVDNDPDIRLVISDAVMPELGGVELFAELQTRPNPAKMLLMSGYSQKAIDPLNALEDIEVLQKPFTPDQLIEVVDRLLAPQAC